MITTFNNNQLSLLKYRDTTIRKTIDLSRSSYIKSDDNKILLDKACMYWNSLESVRKERKRNIKYKNGDQWSDHITDENGNKVKEYDHIVQQGKTPLKHNFIQQFIRNIMGQIVNNDNQSIVYCRSTDDTQLGEMLTNTLQAVNKLNQSDRVSMNILEELLLTGLGCVKVRYDFWSTKNRGDGKIDIVNFNRLFFNTDIEDPRFTDINIIGEFHDYTFDELVRNFAKTKDDEQVLTGIFHYNKHNYSISSNGMSSSKMDNINAFTDSISADKCRVVEIWVKKNRWVTYVHDYADGTEQITQLSLADIKRMNDERIAQCLTSGVEPTENLLMYAEPKNEVYWEVKYLTSQGDCLKEMETPFTHEEHPYVIASLPMIDGNIKAGITDLIDMQRYINRLIVLLDFIIGTSAKGVLMVPENAIPDGMSAQDFADEYTKANGVIVYRPTATKDVPFQISSNSTNVGAWDMLQLQLGLIEKISGLSGAIQGQQAGSNTPSSLYAQEAQNSSVNYAVLFASFYQFQEALNEKMLKVIMQYYTEKRHVDISGNSFSKIAQQYDPDKVKLIIDFNVVVKQSAESPVFKQMTENTLLEFVKSGLLPMDIYLENSQMPFAEKLKATIKNKQDQMMQTQNNMTAIESQSQ